MIEEEGKLLIFPVLSNSLNRKSASVRLERELAEIEVN
jgi:hypothetical protein